MATGRAAAAAAFAASQGILRWYKGPALTPTAMENKIQFLIRESEKQLQQELCKHSLKMLFHHCNYHVPGDSYSCAGALERRVRGQVSFREVIFHGSGEADIHLLHKDPKTSWFAEGFEGC